MSDLATRLRPAATMVELLRLRARHLRSVEIARDYADPQSSSDYVVTPFLQATFERVAASLAPDTTARAWRLTGDYGSGKSSFGLAFARYAAGELDAIPAPLRLDAPRVSLAPVLVVGEREPIGQSVLTALKTTVVRDFGKGGRALLRKLDLVDPSNGREVIGLVEAVATAVKSAGRADGLLFVLDELGKNLEHAARSPADGDLHLLQLLSDAAERSGGTPIVVLAILHQAVSAYADQLASTERREWEKVSGRFQEVVFAPPIEQNAVLVAAALGFDTTVAPKPLLAQAHDVMSRAIEAGWYGAGASSTSLLELAPSLAVLDPIVLPVLSRVLRRFGQNERSLFSFLSSVEPYGLTSHLQKPLADFEPYRLHDLFDYVSANLLSALESGSAGTRWGVVEGVLRSTTSESVVERQALKSVALLNLLDDPGVALTTPLLELALGGQDPSRQATVSRAVNRLKTKLRVLYDRGVGGGLCLWPHTSVDIDAAFQEALAGADPGADLVSALRPVLAREPLIARRHYIETGALRHFELVYARPSELDAGLAQPGATSDGRVLLMLSATGGEREQVLAAVRGLHAVDETVLIGVPEPVAPLAPLLRDVRAWQAVKDGTPALAGDRLARDETSRQLALAEDRLRRSLSGLLDLRGGGAATIRWFHKGAEIEIRSPRALTERLSLICDRAYRAAPTIRNELINRRLLSSAAARARTVLIEALAQAPDKPGLGLDTNHTPPEVSVYLSVFEPGRLHVHRDGRWRVALPDEDDDLLNFRPSLKRIGDVLAEVEDRKVPFSEVVEALRLRPYGIRDGVIPLLISIYLAIHWHHTAVYEDGTYLEQVGGPEFVRMLKEPEHFTLQHCAVDGVRSEVFARLASVLEVSAEEADPDLLDVVRPLLTFAARLSDHARRTQHLSVMTAAVRNVLMRVTDPSALLFTDLPRACGLDPFAKGDALDEPQLDAFVRTMANAVRELRDAYPELLRRIAASLGHAFDAGERVEEVRAALARRAGVLDRSVVEPELKTFLLRLTDTGLQDKAWLESLASFLARKPPERWADSDERDFHHRLKLLMRRFTRVEATILDEQKQLRTEPGQIAYRFQLTAANGDEVEAFLAGPSAETSALESEVSAFLATHGRAGLVAAARALAAAAEEIANDG